MANPFSAIVNGVGTLAPGHVVTATEWNSAVNGIYSYINGTLLGGLNLMAAKGDIYVFDGASMQVLSVGSNGDVLTCDSTVAKGIKFAAAGGTGLTTNGDTLFYNAGNQRLPIGTAGQVLTVVAGLPAWAAAGSGGAVPIGGIIMWSGTIAAIPAGYALCDGTIHAGSQTPNMQGLFCVGAGNVSPAATGGAGLIDPGGPFGSNSAGAGLGPSHSHGVTTAGCTAGAGVNAVTSVLAVASVTPKYFALAYIMRVT